MATSPSEDNPPTYREATGGPEAAGYAPVPGYNQAGAPPANQTPSGCVSAPSSSQAQGQGYGAATDSGEGYAQGIQPGYPTPQQGPYKEQPGSYQGGAVPGFYSGPPGYQPVPGQQPTYLAISSGSTIRVQAQPSVVVVGGCPACRIGVLEDDFTCLGVCCAIFFFPLGILCCLAMRQRRCPNCGAVFG